MVAALLLTVGWDLLASGAALARTTAGSSSSPTRYEYNTHLSLAFSPGALVSIRRRSAECTFTLDADLGARLILERSSTNSPGLAHTITFWPTVGYSFVKLNETPVHLFSTGLGVSIGFEGMGPHFHLTPRFIAGRASDRVGLGLRLDLQIRLAIWGLSVGYQVLFAGITHHGIRLLAMVDLGYLATMLLRFRS